MHEIAQWLEKFGLAKYAPASWKIALISRFGPILADQDLKDLGIVLGDRRKLLRAIGEMDTSGVSNAQDSGSAERCRTLLAATNAAGPAGGR